MSRTTTVLMLAILSSLLTPVVVGATAGAPKRAATTEAVAPAPVARVAAPSGESCNRRIKIVYAGYGEADRMSCFADTPR